MLHYPPLSEPQISRPCVLPSFLSSLQPETHGQCTLFMVFGRFFLPDFWRKPGSRIVTPIAEGRIRTFPGRYHPPSRLYNINPLSISVAAPSFATLPYVSSPPF
ncbi:hypothetical protein HGRIS_001314 [Hohenbuehelia grisea]|uniref:Uncharacterized protein n=1 Tax=Hohenbuehelia grisea TaxID=104357 RepID=A0ABR3JP50_9AGAR